MDSAMMCLTVLTSLAENDNTLILSDSIYLIAYNTLGAIYASRFGDYSAASVNLLKGLNLASQYSNKLWESRIGYNLAAIQYEQGLLVNDKKIFDTTLDKLISSYTSTIKAKDNNLLVPIALSMSEIAIRTNEEGSKNCLSRVIAIFDRYPNSSEIIKALRNVLSSVGKQEYENSLREIDNCVESVKDDNTFLGQEYQSTFSLLKAHLLLQSGREDEALSIYNKMIDLYQSQNHLFGVYEIYNHLRNYYGGKGNTNEENRYKIKELEAKDELITRSRSLSLEESTALFNQEKLKKEISEETAKSSVYRIVLIISGIFILIVKLF